MPEAVWVGRRSDAGFGGTRKWRGQFAPIPVRARAVSRGAWVVPNVGVLVLNYSGQGTLNAQGNGAFTETGAPVGTTNKSGLSQKGCTPTLIGRAPVSSSVDLMKMRFALEVQVGVGVHDVDQRS